MSKRTGQFLVFLRPIREDALSTRARSFKLDFASCATIDDHVYVTIARAMPSTGVTEDAGGGGEGAGREERTSEEGGLNRAVCANLPQASSPVRRCGRVAPHHVRRAGR